MLGLEIELPQGPFGVALTSQDIDTRGHNGLALGSRDFIHVQLDLRWLKALWKTPLFLIVLYDKACSASCPRFQLREAIDTQPECLG